MAQTNPMSCQHKTPTMGVFFSPPESSKPDCFTHSQSPLRQPARLEDHRSFGERLPSIRSILPPPSPPVSPTTVVVQELGSRGDVIHHNHDPQLFPERLLARQDSAQPLFRHADYPPQPYIPTIDAHAEALRSVGTLDPLPTHDEYTLAYTFKQKVVDRYNADPELYMAKELEYLQAYPPRWDYSHRAGAVSSKPKPATDGRITQRQRTAPKPLAEKLPLIRRQPRASPRETITDSFDAEPAQKHRRKVSRTTPISREDMDYRKIPEYSPSIRTMAPGKNLKIDWKGHPLDLGDDPDRHMLDEQEVGLAAVLRLTGAQYLFAKRKIFEKFVELSRVGKDFNKTSAQGVCKIDVNKASKLWTAFEKVGWFDKRLFAQYL